MQVAETFRAFIRIFPDFSFPTPAYERRVAVVELIRFLPFLLIPI
jgi:hypothetical protein